MMNIPVLVAATVVNCAPARNVIDGFQPSSLEIANVEDLISARNMLRRAKEENRGQAEYDRLQGRYNSECYNLFLEIRNDIRNYELSIGHTLEETIMGSFSSPDEFCEELLREIPSMDTL